MAITLTNTRSFMTVNNTTILDKQQTASMFWWFRYEPQGSNQVSQIGGCQIVGRNEGNGPYAFFLQQGPTGYVRVYFSYRIQTTSSFTYCDAFANLAVGVAYPVLMVFSQGQQTLYLPGQTISMGTNTGPLPTGNWGFGIGGVAPGSPCVFTVGDVNVWNGYAATAADYNTLVLGGNPTTIGHSATSRYRWTLAGTSGATPTVGDPGLAEAYAGTYNLSQTSGSGSAVYTAPLTYQPSVQLSPLSHVGTSGQTVFFFLQAVSSGAPATPISINSAPTLYQNGVNLGPLTNPWIDGSRPFVQYNVPAGVQINPGDIVTLSAPNMWCTTAAGPMGSLSGVKIANKTGMSAFGTEALTKKLRMGMNFSHLGTTPDCLYRLQRNQRWNLGPFINATSRLDGTPLSFSGTSTVAELEDYWYTSNGLDSTNYPGQAGLWAIGWNSPPASNTSFAISTLDTTVASITERMDLANPGDSNGNGRVRVFDVEHAAGSTTANLNLYVKISQASGTPNFSNLDIRGPGDFTFTTGQPVTLDQSKPYAMSAIALDRFHNGLGSVRFLDSTIDYGGWSNSAEPWEMHDLTEFSWQYGTKSNRLITYSEVRPYSAVNSPYVYGPPEMLPTGSPYTATLASGIDATTTTITVSDAATAPVFTGLLLGIDSELMSVQSVTGTTVTVFRGASGTTPASHAAGTIQVKNRLAITGLSGLGGSSDQIVEVVCAAPHALRTGQMMLTGAIPALTFTDGSSFGGGNYFTGLLVTGPTTFLWKIGGATAGPVTLSTTTTLSGIQAGYSTPAAGYPYEFEAMVAGQFTDCWYHASIPLCASDSYVYEAARRIRDNLPAGRKVLMEVADEPWNYAFPERSSVTWLSSLAFPGQDWESWYVSRTAQITQIFINVFAATGRGSEVVGLLNSQCAYPWNTRQLLADVQAQSITVPLWIAIAPYVVPDDNATTVAAYNAANTAQVVDLWIHDLYYSPTSLTSAIAQHQAYIAAFNTATGATCQLYAYECGVETCVPSSCNYPTQQTRDATYHPNWWIIEQDFYAWMQSVGFVRASIYAYDMADVGTTRWGIYHGPSQPYGRGDGSDEKPDNRLCLALPGHPYTKAPNVNQDQQNVSVRGSALLHWMQAATPGKTPKKITFRRRQ